MSLTVIFSFLPLYALPFISIVLHCNIYLDANVQRKGCSIPIDASFGLSETLVSGLVNPDTYKIRYGNVVTKRIGTKTLVILPIEDGSTMAYRQWAQYVNNLLKQYSCKTKKAAVWETPRQLPSTVVYELPSKNSWAIFTASRASRP